MNPNTKFYFRITTSTNQMHHKSSSMGNIKSTNQLQNFFDSLENNPSSFNAVGQNVLQNWDTKIQARKETRFQTEINSDHRIKTEPKESITRSYIRHHTQTNRDILDNFFSADTINEHQQLKNKQDTSIEQIEANKPSLKSSSPNSSNQTKNPKKVRFNTKIEVKMLDGSITHKLLPALVISRRRTRNLQSLLQTE
ncbi:hypothetical protein pb186bvf_017163 [Paramecium bursaria]